MSGHFSFNGNSIEYAEMFDWFCTVYKHLTHTLQNEK